MAETKLIRDHHLLTRNLRLNDSYLSNDGGDEGIRIRDDGTVAVGHDNPRALFELLKTTTQLRISYDTYNYATMHADASGDLIIAPTGNVGIGETAPVGTLHVDGLITGSSFKNASRWTRSYENYHSILLEDTTRDYVECPDGLGDALATIDTGKNVTISLWFKATELDSNHGLIEIGQDNFSVTDVTIVITAIGGDSGNSITSGSGTFDGTLIVTFTSGVTTADFTVDPDIEVANATLSNFAATAGQDKIYTATLTPNAIGSTVTIDIDAERFQDADGNKNTVATQFVWTPEQPNTKSVEFDGINDYIDLRDHTTHTGTQTGANSALKMIDSAAEFGADGTLNARDGKDIAYIYNDTDGFFAQVYNNDLAGTRISLRYQATNGNDNTFQTGDEYHVAMPPTGWPLGDTARTITAWINPADIPTGSTYYAIFTYGGVSTGDTFRFMQRDSGLRVQLYPEEKYSSGLSLTAGVWNHVAVTYDGSTGFKFYRNGAEYPSGGDLDDALQTVHGEYFATIGAEILAGAVNSPFKGKIDEVGLFERALTTGEILSIYNAGGTATPDSLSGLTGLVGYWRMGDGDTYPTIQDHSTNEKDGTMENMTAEDIVLDVP